MTGAAEPTLPALREVITTFGLHAKQSLGQHFLLDRQLTDRVARAAGDLADTAVFEIGPGPGGLTRSLLTTDARQIIAIEKDSRCAAAVRALAEAYPAGRLTVIEADALTVDLPALAPPPRVIVANLPYNVGTPLLIRWLKETPAYRRMTLMFQKEVADRLTAAPGSAAYGRLSVITQWQCRTVSSFNVSAKAFTPPPKVASTVVTLESRAAPLAPAAWPLLERVTAAAFGQRRKMLRSSLKPLGLDPAAVGIEPTRRAEELPVAAFCALARLLADREGDAG